MLICKCAINLWKSAVEIFFAYIIFYQLKSLSKCFVSCNSTDLSLSASKDLMKFHCIIEDIIHLGNLAQTEV